LRLVKHVLQAFAVLDVGVRTSAKSQREGHEQMLAECYHVVVVMPARAAVMLLAPSLACVGLKTFCFRFQVAP
jgi:hypothetical protein